MVDQPARQVRRGGGAWVSRWGKQQDELGDGRLKRITGIEPFTIFAVRMGERLTPEEEDPLYRFATARGLVSEPTIFVDSATGRCIRVLAEDTPRGRPTRLARIGCWGGGVSPFGPLWPTGSGLRLVQAFRAGEPATAVPIDQILLGGERDATTLMLAPGSFWVRAIDRFGTVIGEVRLAVER